MKGIPAGRAATVLRPLAFWVSLGLAAAFATVGADARWLAVLGDGISRTGRLPTSIPYAAAPSRGFADVPALAELVFHWLEAAFGGRGLVAANAVAVGAAFAITARTLRVRRGPEASPLVPLVLLAIGGVPALLVVRVQLFSLLLFPLLVLLLQTETVRPSRRLWLVVPLLALWSNLHGVVLVGFGILALYLALERGRREPLTAAAVLVASAAGLLATPALLRTPSYYIHVVGNEAAREHVGVWARLSPLHGFDALLLLAALVLVATALRQRLRTWEIAALAVLAAATIQAHRNGIWLLLFAAPLCRFSLGRTLAGRRSMPLLAAGAIALALVGLARGPIPSGASTALVNDAVHVAHGTPIVAEDILAEQVALAGGRVWMANPLDAFARRDQVTYVAWLRGMPAGDPALAHAPRVVLVRLGSPAQRRVSRSGEFVERRHDRRAVLYVRVRPPSA